MYLSSKIINTYVNMLFESDSQNCIFKPTKQTKCDKHNVEHAVEWIRHCYLADKLLLGTFIHNLLHPYKI